jgi:hypothetical protein
MNLNSLLAHYSVKGASANAIVGRYLPFIKDYIKDHHETVEPPDHAQSPSARLGPCSCGQ